MKKKLTAITLATTMVIGSSFFGNYSFAETTKDLNSIETERSDIKENLSEAEERVSSIISEIETLNHEIERVNTILIEKQAIIDRTNNDIELTIQEINELQEEIIELEKSIEKRFEILRNRASSYQQTGGSVNYLEVIFGSASFTDFISRVSTVNKIAESDATLMEQLEADIQKIEENQKLSMEKLDELNTLKVEQEEATLLVKEQKDKNEQSRKALENKKAELHSLIADLKKKDNNLASLEEKIKASEEAMAEKVESTVPTQAKGKSKPQQSNMVVEKKQTKKDHNATKTFTVKATAYTLQSAGGSGKTYTGIDLRKNPNTKVIAVDPSVIPLGSVVHVEGYGYAVAGDIGSAIKGNKIDVYVPSNKAAINWEFVRLK